MSHKLTKEECYQYHEGYMKMSEIIEGMLKKAEQTPNEQEGIRFANMIMPLFEQFSESVDPLCDTFLAYYDNGQEVTREMVAVHDREIRRIMVKIMEVVENAEALKAIVYGGK